MTPNQISINPKSLKPSWSFEETEQAKREIDHFLEFMADWQHAVRDMGLLYKENDQYAGLFPENGDFYVEEGVRIYGFARTIDDVSVLIGIKDEDDQFLYYDCNY